MKYWKYKLVQHLTKNLLKAVTKDDILLITNNGWVSRGRVLSPDEKQLIQDEAKTLLDSVLWQYLSKEIEYVAFVRGRKAKNDEDNLACHYMFYNLDLIETFLERCKKL